MEILRYRLVITRVQWQVLCTNLKYGVQIHRKDVGMLVSNILIFGKIMGNLEMLIFFVFSQFKKTGITSIISGGKSFY